MCGENIEDLRLGFTDLRKLVGIEIRFGFAHHGFRVHMGLLHFGCSNTLQPLLQGAGFFQTKRRLLLAHGHHTRYGDSEEFRFAGKVIIDGRLGHMA